MSKKVVPILVGLLFGLAGCGGSDKTVKSPEEGPAQRAGEKVDNAAHNVKEGTEHAAHKTGEAVEKGGEEIQEHTDND